MDRRELTTTKEYRNGKLHISRSDGKVYCVVCKKFRTIEKGNCCQECLDDLSGEAGPLKLPLAHDPDPSPHLMLLHYRGLVRGSRRG